VVDGVSRRAEGARLDDVCPCLPALAVMALLEQVHGTARQRERRPCGPDRLRDGRQTLCGIDRMKARPGWRFRAAARMTRVGFPAQQGRQGVCQRGRAKRPGERTPGPLGPATLATTGGQGHGRDREAGFSGVIRAVAPAGAFGQRVPGLAEGPERETPHGDQGGGQATRQRRSEAQGGRGQAVEVTGYGGAVLGLIAAVPTRPPAGKVGPRQAPEALWPRAVVPPRQAQLAGPARRHQGVCERGGWAGTERWWLDRHGVAVGVPAQAHMAVPAEARALAAAGEGVPLGHRAHTVRRGQGPEAWAARRAPAGVGRTGLTPSAPDGPAAHGRHRQRRAVEAHPLPGVVGRQWQGKDEGPGGHPVCLTKAAVATPRPPCEDDDDRRLIAHGGSKEATPPWDLQPPPHQTARAGRGHVVCTLPLCGLATAYRRPGERAALGGEPGGWQRWRRQLLAHNRDTVRVLAPGASGRLQIAVVALLMGANRQEVPSALGTRRESLAKDDLPPKG
jgi:hypothetical protein